MYATLLRVGLRCFNVHVGMPNCFYSRSCVYTCRRVYCLYAYLFCTNVHSCMRVFELFNLLFACIGEYAFADACLSVFLHAVMIHACMHACRHVCVQGRIHERVAVCMSAFLFIMHASGHNCMCIDVRAGIYTYTQVCNVQAPMRTQQ